MRCAAFDSLFVLGGVDNEQLTQYFVSVMTSDPSVRVAHYVARSMLAWLGLAMRERMGGLRSKFAEEFAEEEGHTVLEEGLRERQMATQNEIATSIENLRKRFEENSFLKQTFWKLLKYVMGDAFEEYITHRTLSSDEDLPRLDHCVRKYLLQICEYIFKPLETGVKVTIRMPPAQKPNEPAPALLKLTIPKDKEKEKDKETQPSTTTTPTPTSTTTATTTTATKNNSKTTPSTPPQPPIKKTIVRIRPPQAKKEIPVSPPPSSTASPEPSESTSISVPHPAPPLQQPPAKRTKREEPGFIKECRRILAKLRKHRSAFLFAQPVDEARDMAPGYYDLIKKPMDFGKIKVSR